MQSLLFLDVTLFSIVRIFARNILAADERGIRPALVSDLCGAESVCAVLCEREVWRTRSRPI